MIKQIRSEPVEKSDEIAEQKGEEGPVPDHLDELGASDRTLRFRKALEEAGSLLDVAERMGVHPSTLKRIRAGQVPKLDDAVQLAEVTGVRLEWLATGKGPMRDAPADQPPALQYVDFENLLSGLEIAEELQPEAPPQARISAALRVAARIRAKQQAGEATEVDEQELGRCLAMVETLFGRRRPRIQRLRMAANAYEIMRDDPGGPEDQPPPADDDDIEVLPDEPKPA
jgi:transcriptional regulator with XRE-family HTH domain